MKEVINLLPISSYLCTGFHVRQLTKALDSLQNSIFHQKQHFLTTLEKEVPFPLNEILSKITIANEVNVDDLEEVDRFLSKLRDDIQLIPRMTLTLTIEPDMDLIREINEWVTLNLQTVIILDFAINESLIAGAQIAYNGKIADHSLKKRLEGIVASA